MLIKELNFIGFGKFKNKIIKLNNGFNLIYGENEAGKSTIHSFIDGMFYGFLRPNARTALYLEEYDKYNPWDNSRYSGVIRFDFKDIPYRIERDFTKGEEITKVYDETTGIDITRKINNGNNRILQPGIHFFGFNNRIFSNTVSIKQLGSKTDEKLAGEIKEKLINISTALDENVSVEKAMVQLKEQISEIGTERAHTKPYAINLKELEELEKEKGDILSNKEIYESLLDKELSLKGIIVEENNKLNKLKKDLKNLEIQKKYNMLQEAITLIYEIEELEIEIKKLSRFSKISLEDYKESIELTNTLKHMNKTLDDIYREFSNTENKFKTMKIFSIIIPITSLIICLISIIWKRYAISVASFSIGSIVTIYLLNKINKIKEEINLIDDKNRLRGKILENIEEILINNNVANLNEFAIGLENKRIYEIKLKDLETKKYLLDKILGENTIDSLTKEIQNYNIVKIPLENISEERILYEIDSCIQNINDNKVSLKGLQENINILGEKISRLNVVEEEIQRKLKYKFELESNIQSLQLALDTIEEISLDIHRQFAPSINRKVSELINRITAGKYNNVKISDTLDINIECPSTGRLVNINSLSGGTIDQLYFSLRFGIINSMTEENLPLILDDCFIQYDDNRLSNIIQLIHNISKERQVILFTCQDREERVLKQLGLNYNYIHLT